MFDNVKAVLFDLDGTIYHGSKIIPGANEAIEHCRAMGKRVFFLTNNSVKTREQVFCKLRNMGVECQPGEVVTSGYVSALYALQHGLEGLYVCGTPSLRDELHNMGVETCGPEDANALLIGYDPSFDYEKCTAAVRVALNAEQIIACNKERVFRGEGAKLFPGCGAIVASIEWCANRTVDVLIGKPNTLLLETLCCEFGYGKEDVLMVGDTYESDIAMADRFGCPSVLIGGEHANVVCIPKIDGLIGMVG